MELYHLWIILGILLLIVEIGTPGFVIGCFAIAAFATSIGAYFDILIKWQILLFSISSAIVFFAIRPSIMKLSFFDSKQKSTGTDLMGNKVYMVTETIDNDKDRGYIKVGTEYWRARSENGKIIEVESKIKVKRVEGSTVYVEKETN